jgi:hypothetical protein
MFDGVGDLMQSFERADRRTVWAQRAIVAGIAAVLFLSVSNARAQLSGAFVNCSQTVSTAAATVPFPTSGSGPSAPQVYLRLCNAHASNTLGVNPLPGGTAAIGSAGTLTVAAGGCLLFDVAPIPPVISVIGSAASTTTACWYR